MGSGSAGSAATARRNSARISFASGRAGRRLAAQHGDVPGVADQVVGHGLADPEDGGKPHAEPRVRGKRADQAVVPLGDLRQARQGEVRVGGLRGGGEQRVALARDAEGGELPLRLGHVGEAHPRQPARQGGTGAAHGNERIPAARPGGNTRVTRGRALARAHSLRACDRHGPMVELIPRSVLFGNPERTSPEISPDGSSLAWIAPRDGVLNLWVAPIGTESGVDWAAAAPVTDDTDRGIRAFGWAWDGRHLLYVQDVGGDENWRLYDVDPETLARRDLTPFEGIHATIIGTSQAAARRGARRDQRRQPAAARRVPAEPGLGRAGQGDREPGLRGLARR